MTEIPPQGAVRVPLSEWVTLHPAAVSAAAGAGARPTAAPAGPRERSARLAERLGDFNRSLGNNVDGELDRWLHGADAVVSGQQPGLLGGPLLTLVKACAVTAEVRRRREAGRDAVGFMWLATADDDLEEMGWARIAVGGELYEAREAAWRRGGELGGAARLGSACEDLLAKLSAQATGNHAQAAIRLARACYAPGASLGEATLRFLARVLEGCGIVLVDALEPEVARTGAPVVERVLGNLEKAWTALEAGAQQMRARGWPLPLVVTPARLPVFRRAGDHRERLATEGRGAPAGVLREHQRHPERFLPNAWLRPLVQDAALDTAAAILGGAELAYHLQTAAVREVAGIGRPEWLLRPHVTVVTAAERRLASQLRVEPRHLLRTRMPAHLLAGRALRREVEALRSATEKHARRLAERAAEELPGLRGEIEATARRLEATVAWLAERVDAGSVRAADTEAGRWKRLRSVLRPHGRPQERELSLLAPLLRLGLSWPATLASVLDTGDPGMHLLFWNEGGAW